MCLCKSVGLSCVCLCVCVHVHASLKHTCVYACILHECEEKGCCRDGAVRANNTRSSENPFERGRDGEGESSAGEGWMEGGSGSEGC